MTNNNRTLRTDYLLSTLILSIFSTSVLCESLTYITPIYVKSVTTPYEYFNDINPSWSSDGQVISYERFDENNHEIVLVNLSGKRIKFVSTNISNEEDDLALLLPELIPKINHSPYFAFNISWSSDNEQYVFISNGSTQNFDLYQGNIKKTSIERVTQHESIDNQANWSPTSEHIVFVSSRDNKANLYIYDIVKKTITSLLSITEDVINPVWSPNGNKLALMIGEGNTFQIHIIDDVTNPSQTLRQITHLPYRNNIRPSWSPSGEKIAFFTLNTKNNENQVWEIAVVDSHLNSPITETKISEYIVSSNVIQNSLKGPSWLPDNKHIAYIQYIDDLYNPVYLVNIINKHKSLILTNTKMNRDVSSSKTGILAFQSQDEQWSRIFIAKLPSLHIGKGNK